MQTALKYLSALADPRTDAEKVRDYEERERRRREQNKESSRRWVFRVVWLGDDH